MNKREIKCNKISECIKKINNEFIKIDRNSRKIDDNYNEWLGLVKYDLINKYSDKCKLNKFEISLIIGLDYDKYDKISKDESN